MTVQVHFNGNFTRDVFAGAEIWTFNLLPDFFLPRRFFPYRDLHQSNWSLCPFWPPGTLGDLRVVNKTTILVAVNLIKSPCIQSNRVVVRHSLPVPGLEPSSAWRYTWMFPFFPKDHQRHKLQNWRVRICLKRKQTFFTNLFILKILACGGKTDFKWLWSGNEK